MSKYGGVFLGETLAETLECMPDEQRLRFYDIITAYGIYGTKPELTDSDKPLWIMIRTMIDNLNPKRGAPKGNRNAAKEGGNDDVYDGDEEISRLKEQIRRQSEQITQMAAQIETNQNNSKQIETNQNKSDNIKNQTRTSIKTSIKNEENFKNTHTESNPESIPGEAPAEDEKKGVCFKKPVSDSEKTESEKNAPCEAQKAEKVLGYQKSLCDALATPSRLNTGILENGLIGENRLNENRGKKPDSKPEAEKPPENDKPGGGYDKYSALHPGQSPPNANLYEIIRQAWNTTEHGAQLPPCRLILPNLNAGQRDVLCAALNSYEVDEIVNAIENYMWMRLHPEKMRITLTYGNMFSFLEKALPAFVNDTVFSDSYRKKEN
jgi:hypothetical protein